MSLKVPTIFTAIDKFTAPVERMAKSMGAFGNEADSAAARVERRFRKIGSAAESVAKTSFVIGAAVAAPLVLAAKSAMDFEAKMSNVSTLVDTSKESMKSMGNELLKISQRIPVSIDDLTTSLYDIRSAGISASEAMNTLEFSGKLATAGLSTASEATNIMTSATNAFASEGLTASEIADTLFKTVKFGKTTISELTQAFGATAPIIQSAGIKLADFSAATAALTTLGTPASQAQNQLRAAISNLAKPTKDMQKIFDALGVTSDKEIIEKFGSIGGAFKAIGDEAKKSGVNLAKAFESVEARAAFMSLTGATNEAYTKTLEDMTKGTNALNEAFDKQAETAKAKLQIAQNSIQSLSIEIGSNLLPIFAKFLEYISPIISSVVKWAQDNPKLTKSIVIAAAAFATFALAISGIASLIALFSKAMVIATTAQAAFNFVMSMNPVSLIIIGIAALIALIAIIIAKWDEWGAAVSLFLGPLGFVISLIQSFRRNWDLIKDAFASGGILEGIKMIGKTLLDAVLQPLQQLLSLIGKITGSEMITKAATDLQNFRAELGVNMGAELVNPEQAKQDGLKETINTQRQNVNIDINDKTGRANMSSDNNLVPVQMTSTFAF